MERDANYALVGLSTLILVLGIAIFGVWLARISFNRDYALYDIIFPGPINGLSQGGEVRFNGIKVGEVTKIELYKPNPKNVIAHVRMTSDVPVRTDSYATTEPLGITGITYIQITAGTPQTPLLKGALIDGKPPVIASRRSTLSDLLEGGGTVLARTVEALDRINLVLSNKNIKTFTAVMDDTQAVTAELRSKKQLFTDAQEALQDIDTAAKQISALGLTGQNLLDGDGKRSLKSIAGAAEQTEQTAKDLRAVMARLDGPTTEFATNGLPQLTAAVASLQSAAESLDRLSRELRANPQGLVAKPPAIERKVKP